MDLSEKQMPNEVKWNMFDIFSMLLRKLPWIFAVGAVGALLTFIVVRFFVTPTYESRVSFYVYNTSDAVAHSGTINNSDLQAAENLATTYAKILGSNSIRNAVLDYLDNMKLSRKDLSKMVNIAVVKDTQLLEVVVTSTDASIACDIACAYEKIAPKEIVRITKVGGVEVVDQPEIATEKSSPRTVFDTFIGLTVGAIIAAVYFILRMNLDRTVYLPEDLEATLNITLLGQIPEIVIPETKPKGWNLVEGGLIRLENKRA